MSDEFQLASSGNWWDSPRTTIAPPSTTVPQIISGSFGWPPPPQDLTRSIDSSSDPNLHMMMGLGLSSQPILDHWHHNILNGGGKGENPSNTSFRSMLQLEDDHMNLSDGNNHHDDQEFKQSNLGFSLNHHQQQQQIMDPLANYGSPSTNILQGSLASHQQEMYQSSYGMNSNGLLPSWNPKYPTHLLRTNQSVMQQQQQQQFSGNVSFWNTEAQTNFFPPSPPPTFTQSSTSVEHKPKNVVEIGEMESGGIKKGNITDQLASNKRQRSSETVPSQPTFKVKKEKMGDRITALQQLVSPFGKTDTASVLSEAIQYIKFLHEQVSVLSNPYMKSGAPSMQHHKMINHDNSKDLDESKQDLRSRGLCLVPIMSTFAVTHGTAVDFWNPTFGGTFR